MKKNRILSLILSVMMMFTIVFPVGVFAEEIETQGYEPKVEEVVVELGNDPIPEYLEQDDGIEPPVEEQPVEEQLVDEQPVDEQPVDEQPVDEQPVEEQPVDEQPVEAQSVEEQPVEEEVLPFAEGYVRVNSDTMVYAGESKRDEIGSFSGDAIVYAVVSSRDADEAYTWLKITFDTDDAKEADEALLSGYVQFRDVTVLSDESAEQLVDALKYDSTTRSYGDNPLPAVSFNATEDESFEEVIAASIPEEEELLETVETESDVSEVYAASTPVATITGQPESKTAAPNTNATFSVVAVNAETYQWQYSKNGGESWTNCGTLYEGYDTNTVKVKASTGRNGWLFRCVVTGGGVTDESEPATLTVDDSIILNEVTYKPLTSTTCTVVSYSGTGSSLTIPDTVENMTVTEIGVEAFMDNKKLVSIDLPDTITVIRARAFKGCTSLSDMH